MVRKGSRTAGAIEGGKDLAGAQPVPDGEFSDGLAPAGPVFCQTTKLFK
jgi:hypothetical protein